MKEYNTQSFIYGVNPTPEWAQEFINRNGINSCKKGDTIICINQQPMVVKREKAILYGIQTKNGGK